jgi:Fe-S cluster assembly protein SufB
MNQDAKSLLSINKDYDKKYGFSVKAKTVVDTGKGLNEEVVRKISALKNEPSWMLDIRLKALKVFNEKSMPSWGADLNEIDFNDITYYLSADDSRNKSWEDVPQEIKDTFDRLGVPESERKFFGGVGAQFDSGTVYHNLRKDLADQGVVFLDTDTGLKKYPELFKEWFNKIVPMTDNKFAALNTAVWSGGSFLYVPKGVKVSIPLQAYFRINAEKMGQFERTLIIVDEGADVTYIEGCTAPSYSEDSLHAAVVEVVALKDAKVRYTTVQNWSSNVYNLVTKRAYAFENSVVEWIDGNLGSKVTMKYPSVYLKGKNSRADILSVAFANSNQHQDAGSKVIHFADDTQSRIISKSISVGGGRSTYRGLTKVFPDAKNCTVSVQCDGLLLDEVSRTDAYPMNKIENNMTVLSHEASVGKIDEDHLFYLMSRGFGETEATALIVLGFINEFTKQLPMDYALELNRLIEMELEKAELNWIN